MFDTLGEGIKGQEQSRSSLGAYQTLHLFVYQVYFDTTRSLLTLMGLLPWQEYEGPGANQTLHLFALTHILKSQSQP